jgi:amidase
MRMVIDTGIAVSYEEYMAAVETVTLWRAWFADSMRDCDALVPPSANGCAPAGLGSTGAATFQEIWTLLGAPTITLPLRDGPGGSACSVQFVGRPYGDAALLALSKWVVSDAEML